MRNGNDRHLDAYYRVRCPVCEARPGERCRGERRLHVGRSREWWRRWETRERVEPKNGKGRVGKTRKLFVPEELHLRIVRRCEEESAAEGKPVSQRTFVRRALERELARPVKPEPED